MDFNKKDLKFLVLKSCKSCKSVSKKVFTQSGSARRGRLKILLNSSCSS